jgi:hypothetical protein
MDIIIKLIKAFDGDLMGGYLRDREAMISTFNDIDCRIEKDALKFFINVLSVSFCVVENIVGINYRKMNIVSYNVSPRNNSENWTIKLDILLCSYASWISYPCDFDVNLLAENNDALHIRPHISPALLLTTNRIDTILNRTRNMQFALVNVPKNNFQDILVLLLRSKTLVEKGWIMDDYYLGNSSWIFNKWELIDTKLNEIRKSLTTLQIQSTRSQNECCLCHEKFKNDDIVFNSCCNHNFHWQCYPESNSSTSHELSGIYNWFSVKQSYNCPYCRQEAIKFSILYIIPMSPRPITQQIQPPIQPPIQSPIQSPIQPPPPPPPIQPSQHITGHNQHQIFSPRYTNNNILSNMPFLPPLNL